MLNLIQTNSINIIYFYYLLPSFWISIRCFSFCFQFWTYPCVKTRRTLMTNHRFPMLSTPTLPSGAPKPGAWRSASSPGHDRPPFATASTLGASSQPVAGTQVVAAAQTAGTATLWATIPPLPTRSPTVTLSPHRTVTHLPSKPTPRAARTQLHPLTPF